MLFRMLEAIGSKAILRACFNVLLNSLYAGYEEKSEEKRIDFSGLETNPGFSNREINYRSLYYDKKFVQ